MNVFIILSVLVIVLGIVLLVASLLRYLLWIGKKSQEKTNF